jgi:hypothetical protein
MIVAVIAMRMVQLTAHEVIDMVAMRYGLVPAVCTVLMRATDFRCAAHGVFGADINHMFVNVIPMHMMKMAVVKIIDMAIMANRGVSAVWSVLMGVVGMVLLGTGGHDTSSFIFQFSIVAVPVVHLFVEDILPKSLCKAGALLVVGSGTAAMSDSKLHLATCAPRVSPWAKIRQRIARSMRLERLTASAFYEGPRRQIRGGPGLLPKQASWLSLGVASPHWCRSSPSLSGLRLWEQ